MSVVLNAKPSKDPYYFLSLSRYGRTSKVMSIVSCNKQAQYWSKIQEIELNSPKKPTSLCRLAQIE